MKRCSSECRSFDDTILLESYSFRLVSYFPLSRFSNRFCEEIERRAHIIFLIQLVLSTYNISLVGFKLVGVSETCLFLDQRQDSNSIY